MNAPNTAKRSTASLSSARAWAVTAPAMLVPFLFSWFYFVIFPGTFLGNALYVTMKVLLVVWPLLATWAILRVGWRPLFVIGEVERPKNQSRWRDAGWGFVMGAGIVLLMVVLLVATPIGDGVRDGAAAVRTRVAGMGVLNHFLIFAVFLSVIHSLIEEVYWRGFVFGNLRRLIPTGWAHLAAGVAFSAHHIVVLSQFFSIELAWFLGMSVGVGGLLWTWLFTRQGSLLGAWVSHMVVDFGIMAIGAHLMGLL